MMHRGSAAAPPGWCKDEGTSSHFSREEDALTFAVRSGNGVKLEIVQQDLHLKDNSRLHQENVLQLERHSNYIKS